MVTRWFVEVLDAERWDTGWLRSTYFLEDTVGAGELEGANRRW
jgi:hypothetical protein